MKRGPVVEVVEEVAKFFLETRGLVRRQYITTFICGSGPKHSAERSALRPVATNVLNHLVGPGRINKVSDAPTGSGELQQWSQSGRPSKFSDEELEEGRLRLRNLVEERWPIISRFLQMEVSRRNSRVVRDE